LLDDLHSRLSRCPRKPYPDPDDEQFLETPFYGSRQMRQYLRHQGIVVGRGRVRRLMRKMELIASYQKPRTSQPHPEHNIYPYLLRGLAIKRPDQVR
ncbi:MAG: hypothetical protein CXZ00_16600, partial [Acidobacteria bacterium]